MFGSGFVRVDMIVPVVDFSACSLARCQIRTSEPSLSAELRAAFTQVGFVFLKNTGISQDEVRGENLCGSGSAEGRTSI